VSAALFADQDQRKSTNSPPARTKKRRVDQRISTPSLRTPIGLNLVAVPLEVVHLSVNTFVLLPHYYLGGQKQTPQNGLILGRKRDIAEHE
jgi:hypothetical protein